MTRESLKNKKERISQIISILKLEYPNSKCSLVYESPFQLLVATILSAQCTDERVNKVTSKIFPIYPDAYSFSKLAVNKIGELIYSTGFYNNKAKNIKAMSDIVARDYLDYRDFQFSNGWTSVYQENFTDTLYVNPG